MKIQALLLAFAILVSQLSFLPSALAEAENQTRPETTGFMRPDYEIEVNRVLSEKLVTSDPKSEANKCEVLQIMARKFKWQLSTLQTTVFTDVPGWCIPLTNTARETGVIKGRTDTLLGLDTPVTRNEVATMLHRELKRQNYLLKDIGSVKFSDTTPDWATESVVALAREGIIKGFEDGTFGGEKGILKQDLGIMLNRLKVQTPLADTTPPVSGLEFFDSNLVGSWSWQKTTQGIDLIREITESDIPFILTLETKGQLSVKGDCNAISGKFTQTSSGNIKIGPLAMTKMLCDGSIENGFVTTLSKAATYTLNDTNLVIYTTGTEADPNRAMYFTKIPTSPNTPENK